MYLVKFADGWLVAGQKWRVAASFQIRAYSRLVLTVFWYLKICNLRTLSIAVKRGGGLGAVKCQAAGGAVCCATHSVWLSLRFW